MNWKVFKLGECCEVVGGATPETSKPELWDGEIRWATPKDLSGLESAYIHDTPRKITELGLRSCSAAILPANSVLFSSRAPIGHVAINTVPMCTNQGFKSFVPNRKLVDEKFLYYWLRKNTQHFQNLGNGATFKEVSKATVSAVDISLPPLEEQRRIAEVLDRADAMRQKRRLALQKLDTLLQSVFIDMFGDPARNPKQWETGLVSDIAHKVTDGEHQTPQRSSEGVYLLSARNIQDGYISLSDVDYVEESEFKRIYNRCNPELGDILISCSGTIGRVTTVDIPDRFTMVRSAALVKPNTERVVAKFLEHYLRTPFMKATMIKRANASSQANLFIGQIKNLPVYLPPIDDQIRFSDLAAKHRALFLRYRSLAAAQTQLFMSLQQRAFGGTLFSNRVGQYA
jgi:type I restriction enzyme, S subunit